MFPMGTNTSCDSTDTINVLNRAGGGDQESVAIKALMEQEAVHVSVCRP
jgi:hypothetical protein